jgi:hypothetical protein
LERKQWLTMLYREANLFIEKYEREGQNLSVGDIREMEPELHAQLQEIISNVDYLPDLVKYSLLKDPSAELWRGEKNWDRVLLNVASACVLHDVQGILWKILDGSLPRTPSTQLLDPI